MAAVEKDFIKHKGGGEKTDLIAVNEFLDDEIMNLSAKMNTAEAKSMGSMKIRMVSEEIRPLSTAQGPGLMVGICRLDDKYYGAIHIIATGRQYAEELIVPKGMSPEPLNIKSTRLIIDATEWHVISEFFITQKVFEMARIINWAFTAQNEAQLMQRAQNLIGIEEVNKRLAKKHKAPITPMEIASKVMKKNTPLWK